MTPVISTYTVAQIQAMTLTAIQALGSTDMASLATTQVAVFTPLEIQELTGTRGPIRGNGVGSLPHPTLRLPATR